MERSRWQRRLDCHGNRWCCQHVDGPHCNGRRDPHLLARVRYVLVQRWLTFQDEH